MSDRNRLNVLISLARMSHRNRSSISNQRGEQARNKQELKGKGEGQSVARQITEPENGR